MRTTGVMALIGCLALTACEFGGDDTIFKEFSAQDGNSVSVDAHQRAIVATHVHDSSGRLARTIYCAEPSPDAFASISRTITGSLTGQRDVDEKFAVTLAQSLARQASHALSARNATIQLLRDGLYRACEGYASGALTPIEYSEITRQYQHIMAALLSIELLTNINRPRRQTQSSTQPDSNDGGEENKKDGAAAVDESQIVPGYRALKHESIERIAVVAHELVMEAMNIGASARTPTKASECLRMMRSGTLPPDTVVACNKVLVAENIREVETGTQAEARTEAETEVETEAEAEVETEAETGLQSALEGILPRDTPVGNVTLGGPILINFEYYEISKTYIFEVHEMGRYEITVVAVPPYFGDPAIVLSTTTDEDIIGVSDDTEGGLDSKIEMAFEEGEYAIRVLSLGEDQGSFELLIEKIGN